MKQVKAYLLLLMVMVFAAGCSSSDDFYYDEENPAEIMSVMVNGKEYKNTIADAKKVKKFHFEIPEAVEIDFAKVKIVVDVKNGWLENFDNSGQKEMDLSRGIDVQLKEFDGKITKWIITAEKEVTFEEAGIKSITANGEALEFTKNENNKIEAKVATYTKTKDAALEIELPKGWELVGDYTKVDLTKDLEIKIKGGKEGKEEVTFTLKVDATVTVKAVFEKSAKDLGYGYTASKVGAGSSVAFSAKNVVVASHAMEKDADAGKAGLLVYDLTGNYVSSLSLEGTTMQKEGKLPGDVAFGIRKIASDIDGTIVGVELGANATNDVELSVYKWEAIDAKPVKVVSFKGAEVGLGAADLKACRTGGIRVDGSLAKDATIVVPIINSKNVLVWKVKDGKAAAKPELITHKHEKTGNYISVGAFGDKFMTAVCNVNATDKGVHLFSDKTFGTKEATFGEGLMSSEFRVISHNGATLLAYPNYVADKKASFTLQDITIAAEPIDLLKKDSAIEGLSENSNRTMGADIASIDGKLYAVYLSTDDGVHLFQIGK